MNSKMSSRGKILAVILCALVFLPLASCKKEEKQQREKVVNVIANTVKAELRQSAISAIGTLEAVEEVTISAETEGRVKSFPFAEGEKIGTGEKIAIIDEENYQLAAKQAEAVYNQALANRDNIASEFKRREILFKEQLSTKQDFDNIRTKYELSMQEEKRAKSALDIAQRQLSKCLVLSPLDGFIKTKIVSPGDFVRSGTPLSIVIDISRLKMVFSVHEIDASRIKMGQRVVFSVEALPGSNFVGEVSSIGAHIDERTRTLRAEALVDNEAHLLRPGYFAKATIYAGDPKRVLLIPVNAVVYEGDISRVFAISNETTARAKVVKLGEKYGDMVEVLSGLKNGEQVVTTGHNNLVEGVKVNVAR
ncbi:MAG: efflux RND transporter periplasmic adaptor subunit [Deltaproteobacteria bacterium]|nr:efflux RND transporter periplasmic adaptor subunit [Deltaproteobacteria bacterium]